MDPRADGDATIVCWNRSSGERIASLPVTTEEEITSALSRARAAQARWRALSVGERVRVIRRVAKEWEHQIPKILRIVCTETGKPKTTALWAELVQVSDWLRWYPSKTRKALRPEIRKPHLSPHRAVAIEYHPRGVVCVIAPWNYPIAIPTGDLLPALLAGNAVILKPSEVTPLCAFALRDAFVAGGLDPDLFQVLPGYGSVGAHLIEQGVDMVLFTGSVATGKKVAEAAGRKLTPCVLELGGKAPAIVLPGANIKRTARAITWGAFFNTGHTCVGVDRIYAVGQSTYDALLKALQDEIRKIAVDEPFAPRCDMGSIIHEPQVWLAQELLEDAVAKGATIALGGNQIPDHGGCYFEPTLVTGCHHGMKIMNVESFAPLLPMQCVASVDDAVELANDSTVGLSGYVFGPTGKARKVASRVEAGMISVNNTIDHFAITEVRWGGIKDSGLGRAHGWEAIRDACTERVIVWPDLPVLPKELWWFPYSDRAFRFAFRLGRLLTSYSPAHILRSLLRPSPAIPNFSDALPQLPQGSSVVTQKNEDLLESDAS